LKIPSPISKLDHPLFIEKGVEVYIKRDDLIHSVISGNKWRKLKLNVEKFHQGKYDKLLTFGGAYSNHIAATARSGKELGFQTVGIIRGDELSAESNTTLKQADEDGMELVFTAREEYGLRSEKYYHEELRRRHGHVWIVPEGGANYYGVLGCVEIASEDEPSPTHVFSAAGTGTTVAGLMVGFGKSTIYAVSALKNGAFLKDDIELHLRGFDFDDETHQLLMSQLQLETEYHFGGYAKHNEELITFMNSCFSEMNIPLDKVYTAKMFYALMDKLKKDKIPSGSTVLALHTGGLQGNKSISSLLNF
jgi:1-aminocyclopropane-1-carboxylate deaminase